MTLAWPFLFIMRGRLFCLLLRSLITNDSSEPHATRRRSILIIGLNSIESSVQKFKLETLATLNDSKRVVALDGDVVSISDDMSRTHVINWRNQRTVVLESTQDQV